MTAYALPFDDGRSIQQRFEDFHARHPEVYAELVKLAREAKRRGHRRYSIDALIQVYRWQREGDVDPTEGFKITDHFSSRYARLLMQQEPDLAGLFETRTLKAS